ncbi:MULTISPECIES: DNA-formamidopyrimidine glycosylase [Bacillus]|uniref:DNA-formamidopyrimidine glycosylase n=1 Tax=Bacillus TaxID=1386 RepID=UPI0002DDA69E|nr:MULTISPECIES: DNA-formamidopyrimidine glycosylase [Bacillus]
MPELPEVETVRKTLEHLVVGKIIQDVVVQWPNIIKKPVDHEQFSDALKGQEIEAIGRRGKFLIFYLTDLALVSHLRMEGKYGVFSSDVPLEKHTHVIFTFTDGTEMRYKDVRKFGTMHLFVKGDEMKQLPLKQLGPEPLSNDFSAEALKGQLEKTSRNIKAVILDQKTVVGVGNIYVDEALFRSQIHPARIASSLSDEEVNKLVEEIKATLSEAIEQGGSTIRSYINSQGQIGMFQQQLLVYSRNGEECKNCGTPIDKIKVAGRGTHYCPNCQKL